jgi:DtxR family Mn-dependent transcriptional regulator
MMNPVTALMIVCAMFFVIALMFWPKAGLLSRWQRLRDSSLRVLMEDALKHAYDCEYRQITCSRQSIAGALSITADKASSLLDRLVRLGLVRLESDGFVLTDDGRSYALRIIRVHRLWERYLADETGVRETEWHDEAEKQEHRMTQTEAEALAAQMGNPRYDPHGDPIPTAAGEVPRLKGKPLHQMQQGVFAEIIHIEDEPVQVYSQIVAQGLYPGVRVRVIEANEERIVFEANGVEQTLAPIVAANVTVQALAETVLMQGPFETLASLKPGERGKVLGISRACRGQQRRRLMDLGVVPGTIISAELRSASGDPVAYGIRGATIALRQVQAQVVYIEKEREAA